MEESLVTLKRYLRSNDDLKENLEQQLEIIRTDLNQLNKIDRNANNSEPRFEKSCNERIKETLSRTNTEDSIEDKDIQSKPKTITKFGPTNAVKIGYFLAPYLKHLQTGLGPNFSDDMQQRNNLLGGFKYSGFSLPPFTKANEDKLVSAVKEFVEFDGLQKKIKPLLDKKDEIIKKIEDIKSGNFEKLNKKSKEEAKRTLQNYANGLNK